MWWEALESMIHESYEVKIDTDKANADVSKVEAANNEKGAIEEVSN